MTNKYSTSLTVKHPSAVVYLQKLASGVTRVTVELSDKQLYMPRSTCETTYSFQVIQKLLELKGPNWLCNELMRVEDPTYVLAYIECAILSYVKQQGSSSLCIFRSS